MGIKGARNNERRRLAKIVGLVLSAMKHLGNEDGCTIGKIVDYITDFGHQNAPKRAVVAALKRSVEFGIMKKRRGRYFLKYNAENIPRRVKKNPKRATMKNQTIDKSLKSSRPTRRKIVKKKRRATRLKSKGERGGTKRKIAIRRSPKLRHWRTPKSRKFFELYVNPCCRVSAKSSVASTQMLVQEETENCV